LGIGNFFLPYSERRSRQLTKHVSLATIAKAGRGFKPHRLTDDSDL